MVSFIFCSSSSFDLVDIVSRHVLVDLKDIENSLNLFSWYLALD